MSSTTSSDGDRLPTSDDEQSLPYLVAFIKEVTRCARLPSHLFRSYTDNNDCTEKVAPGCSVGYTPRNKQGRRLRRLRYPGRYDGLVTSSMSSPCPFQSGIHTNGLLHVDSALVNDPSLFEDPETFNPSRFLKPHSPVGGNWNGKVEGEFTMPFGFGRRVCPGMHIGLHSTFISIARCVLVYHCGGLWSQVLRADLGPAEFSGRSTWVLPLMGVPSTPRSL